MQPTYLPWAGYFNLIASVDQFVFLDDVQFERNSWQCKNRILLAGKDHTLMVPVQKAPLQTRIDEIRVDDAKPWRTRHIEALTQAYSETTYGRAVLDRITPVIGDTNEQFLARLNIRIIREMCAMLGLHPQFSIAGELACDGHRSEHVAKICDRLGEDEYLSPPGAREYLEADGFAGQYGKQLRFQAFEPAEYRQDGAAAFVSHLSIVDVLAHVGPERTRAYVGART
jgi:hypothetical protein